ncbi:uncharacterized protein LOC110693311 [Chenopodium quinoa]|uniref:uncharacterized protein LOC110693311 n=1 Tax=Chenopodium quinoa TaxID=63459 RepID=UPI000B76E36B|nr:uncharacterized protein LOC110693311 [Chenopodium quinoa]
MPETTIHAVILCPKSLQLWRRSGCHDALPFTSSDSFGEVLLGWAKNLSAEVFQKCLFLTWFIWFRRNKLVFENVWDPDEAILLRHSRLVADFGEYTERIYGGISPSSAPASRSKWDPPSFGLVKVNVDAKITEDGWVGLEAKAALFEIRKAKAHGLRDIVLEADSLVLVTKMKKGSFSFAAIDGVLEDISSVSSDFSSIVWSHVKRDGNFVAHHLARRSYWFTFGFCTMLLGAFT